MPSMIQSVYISITLYFLVTKLLCPQAFEFVVFSLLEVPFFTTSYDKFCFIDDVLVKYLSVAHFGHPAQVSSSCQSFIFCPILVAS